MKHKIYQLLCMGLLSTMLIQSISPIYADELEGNAGVGENVEMESGGNSGIHGSEESNQNTNTGGGVTGGGTNAQVNDNRSDTQKQAQSAQNSANNIIQGWIDKIENQGMHIPQSNSNTVTPNINEFGSIKIPESVLQELMEHVNGFKDHIYSEQGRLENLSGILNHYDEENNSENPHRYVDGNEEAFFRLSETEKAKIKNEIMRVEGLVPNVSGNNIIVNRPGTGGLNSSLIYQGSQIPPFILRPSSGSTGALGGHNFVRPDIIENGFQDFDNWTDRFDKINAIISNSNAMDDYLAVGLIKDFHISDVKVTEYEEVNYTSDRRRWNVTDARTGESIQTLETDNPEHELSMSFNREGEYLVVAEQPAKYRSGIKVYYDACEYLFDMETKNLLYFNEKILADGRDNRKTVLVKSEEKEGWVPTGDSFRWNINDLNEHEKNGNATERIE